MSAMMDLVAGDRREILLAITVDDWASLADNDRFAAHLSLGAGLDPTWLDLFAEAARRVTGSDQPSDFLDAREEIAGERLTERFVERIDGAWVAAVAALEIGRLDAVAGRWIDLIQEEMGELGADEKPWIRELAGQLVSFARAAARAPDVLLAWSL